LLPDAIACETTKPTLIRKIFSHIFFISILEIIKSTDKYGQITFCSLTESVTTRLRQPRQGYAEVP
jgi:hypothetical protein